MRFHPFNSLVVAPLINRTSVSVDSFPISRGSVVRSDGIIMPSNLLLPSSRESLSLSLSLSHGF